MLEKFPILYSFVRCPYAINPSYGFHQENTRNDK
jgi:hypothetical protein